MKHLMMCLLACFMAACGGRAESVDRTAVPDPSNILPYDEPPPVPTPGGEPPVPPPTVDAGVPPVPPLDAGTVPATECVPGAEEPCYDGPPGTRNVGECLDGMRYCGMGGTWGACLHTDLPESETCNQLDDDCDGQVDEDCVPCHDLDADDYYAEGCGFTPDCDDTSASVTPFGPETCDNGVDDNCDGQVDENCQPPTPSATYCEPWTTDGTTFGYHGCCGTFMQANQKVTVGDLIKGSNPAVYYYGSDGKRYLFPTTHDLNSWYAPLDSWGIPTDAPELVCGQVKELEDAELAAISLGGNVLIRPGTYVTACASCIEMWAVGKGHMLRKLISTTASMFPEPSIALRLRTTPDFLFVKYVVGTGVNGPADYDRLQELQVTIEQDLGLQP